MPSIFLECLPFWWQIAVIKSLIYYLASAPRYPRHRVFTVPLFCPNTFLFHLNLLNSNSTLMTAVEASRRRKFIFPYANRVMPWIFQSNCCAPSSIHIQHRTRNFQCHSHLQLRFASIVMDSSHQYWLPLPFHFHSIPFHFNRSSHLKHWFGSIDSAAGVIF